MNGAGKTLRSTAVVSACTGLSRVLGFVREVLMAQLFGTTLAKSAFDVAFLVPNLFRRLFGEGALAAAFIPVFTDSVEREGRASAALLAGRVMALLGVTLAALVVAGLVAISLGLRYLPLGERAAAVLPLLRIMLPYMFFICLVALCMAILNSYHRFAAPAATPALLNVVWILALLFVCKRFGDTPGERIRGVAWGILVAGVLQLAVQVPALWRQGCLPRLSLSWKDPRVATVLLRMWPVAVGMGVFQVNAVVDRLLALFVAEWAPAALTYAERLIYLPLGVIATALGTVLLPTFSKQAAQGQNAQIRETLGAALRHLLLVMIPAAVGLLVLASPIVQLVFAWRGGEFSDASTVYTARALLFYAPGLVVFSLYKVLVPAFYALGDTRTPVRIGVGAVVMNLVLNVVFIMTWPQGYRHAGLAFASVLASLANSAVLAVLLHRRIGSPGWARIARSAGGALAAAALMAVTVWWLHGRLASGALAAGKPAQLVAVGGSMASGVAVYVVAVLLACRADVREIMRAVRR